MAEVKEIVSAVKELMSSTLSGFAMKGLEEASVSLRNQTSLSADGQKIFDEQAAIIQRFLANLESNFDELISSSRKEVNVLDYGSLSLVEEDDLEAIIAMEGMIAHSRNCDIREYLSFSTRLDTLFYGTRIDESNNPMDPEQIGDAYKEAVRPVGLSPAALLVVYRYFNSNVFHELEQALAKANEILVGFGVLPNLDIDARNKKLQQNKRSARREKTDPAERAFAASNEAGAQQQSQQQLFSMMQGLMHGMPGQLAVAPAGRAAAPVESSGMPSLFPAGMQPGMMIGSQRVEMVPSNQLLDLLGELQTSLQDSDNTRGENEAGILDVSKSIGELLQQKSSKESLKALDSQSADIINLITLLYEAIWQDETVPIPVKELVGRTQITILTIALEDASFFDSETHPARVFINELATAGISWTEFDKLEQDPMYKKMRELVGILVSDYKGDLKLVEGLNHDFIMFKRNQSLASQEVEQRLAELGDRESRLEEINQYALEKISDRILDEHTPAFVKDFLENQFHKFVVQVLLREGPGGVSWKPVMNTIDVLLWTVQKHKREGDLQRFQKVNPRLLVNLGKALDVAGIEKSEAGAVLKELRGVQERCFSSEGESPEAGELESSDGGERRIDSPVSESEPDLDKDDEHLLEVSNYPIGIWMEFQVDSDHSIRCTLAAKIDTIDKYVFVNSRGVKVIEKSKMGLARELKAGSVKVISEAPLLERAMETVIGRLRGESQEQNKAR